MENEINFEQELYKAFGRVNDFTLGMQIAKWFYDMGRKYHEPVSDDLEKIVEEIAEPTILNAYGTKELARRLRNTIYGTSVSDDLEEEIIRYIGYPQEVDEDVSTTMIRKAARHFANWQKKQMIAKAVDGTARPDDNEIWCNLASNNLKDGDKVKVIVIKEG